MASPLQDLHFILKRDDDDAKRVYGGWINTGETINWVARLQKLLSDVGFAFDVAWAALDGTAPRAFDRVTEWAVREFQVAARYARILKAGASVANGFPNRDEVIPSGVVDARTREALNFWSEEPYRCPVEIDEFRADPSEIDSFTPGTPGAPALVAGNLWLFDPAREARDGHVHVRPRLERRASV